MEELKIRVNGVAVDVLTEEWMEEDVLNKSPVVIEKITKRKGGFTIHMQAPTEKIEWYFSKGLTEISIKQGKQGRYLHIEHEDGLYWVDLPPVPQILEFLKEFMD